MPLLCLFSPLFFSLGLGRHGAVWGGLGMSGGWSGHARCKSGAWGGLGNAWEFFEEFLGRFGEVQRAWPCLLQLYIHMYIPGTWDLKLGVLGPGTWEHGNRDLETGTWDLGLGTWDLRRGS